MLYFGFIYLLLLVFKGRNYEEKVRFYLVIFPFLLIIFLRYGYGADYFSYENIYEKIDPYSIIATIENMPKIEPIYILLNAGAKILKIPYHLFAGMYASAITILILKWLKSNSPYFELSALMYYSFLFTYWNISALRQGIVVTILLFIYFNKSIELTRFEKTIIVVITFFMHPTAIIVPIIYFISMFEWRKEEFYILLLFAPIIQVLFRFVLKIIPESVPYINKIYKYVSYNAIEFISLPSLMRFTFFIFIVHHYIRLVKKYPDYRIMFNFSLLSLIMYFYLPTAMVVGTRTTIFGYYLIIIIFPMILSLYKSKEIYTIVLYGILGLSLISFYNELDKMVARTAYKYDMHQLNKETILQQNRQNFNKK